MNVSVSIVEDDAAVRVSLAKLIDTSPGFRCASQYADAESAIKEAPKVKPDVLLMDISLPGLDGVECTRRLKPQLPDTEIIVFTIYQNTEYIFNALAAGASGYMLKQTPAAELLAGIREVHAGGSPMSGHIARKVVQVFQQMAMSSVEIERLSPREAEVLALLARGHRYKEIAMQLSLGYSTIHTHIRNIYKKLHTSSRTEAAAKYFGCLQADAK